MTSSHSSTPPSGTSTSPRSARLILFVLIILCILFAASYTSRLVKKSRVEAQIQLQEQLIQASQEKQLVYQAELAYVTSEDYADEVAREELDLAKVGDKVIVVLESTPLPPPSVTPESSSPPREQPALLPVPTPSVRASQVEAPADVHAVDRTPPGDEPVWRQWFSLFAPSADETSP